MLSVVISSWDGGVDCFGQKVQFMSCINVAQFNLIIYIRDYLAEVIYLNVLIPVPCAFLDIQMGPS